jgi:hypothetical protein
MIGTLWLFGVGFVSLPIMLINFGLSVMVLMIGYASVIVLDPISARRGEAPRHFIRLRPPQMSVTILGLGVLLVATR